MTWLKKAWRIGAMIGVLSVSACTLTGDSERPTIGSGTDDYKSSPCACKEVPQRFKNQYVG